VTKVHAVLLAAGRSRRLGRPKQLVTLGTASETLLARAARALSVPEIASLRIVLGDPDPAIDAEAARTGALLVRSADPAEGSAASVRAAMLDLRRTEREPHGILFAVVDQPALSAAHVATLVEVFRRSGGAVPVGSRYAGTLGVPAVFPSAFEAALLGLRGDEGARRLLRSGSVGVDLPGGEHDVDVPHDLELRS
jgi:CTP:molybdopterin cytidylyltransferase MocA